MTTTFTTTNKIVFSDILAAARTLGAQAGKGADTQVKFLLQVVEGAYHGAIDLVPHKHGDGIDDATALAEAYVKARQGEILFDARAANQRKLISTVRLGIRLGTWDKGGPGEPLATVNALMSLRQRVRREAGPGSRIEDAANTLFRYGREQLKRDTLMSSEELEQFCFRPMRAAPTLETALEGVIKKLDGLIEEGASIGVTRARNNLRKVVELLSKEQAVSETA